MIRKFSSLVLAALMPVAAALCGCDKESSDSSDSFVDLTTSTMVTNFKLEPNRKVLANLDSVFFSIDLANREIYNADSLPYGTDVSHLVVSVTVPNDAVLKMLMPNRDDMKKDTTVNLNTNPKDSILFVDGRNYLYVTSPNKKNTAIYSVKVNVHKVLPDSLRWSSSARGTLPTDMPWPAATSTVCFGGKLLSLSSTNVRTTLNVTTDPYDLNGWESAPAPQLPANADVNTLTATTDALYMIGTDGSLHTTSDPMMASWDEAEAASAGWTYIYGAFGNKIVGVRGNSWATYPESASGAIADLGPDFPVRQTTRLVEYSSDWS
ncbi:MAG: hypothetical protein K2M97_02215, partial [Muribaculaceae bacterium]|nr:hypothetical protein [Muribaculaceae bacterium]